MLLLLRRKLKDGGEISRTGRGSKTDISKNNQFFFSIWIYIYIYIYIHMEKQNVDIYIYIYIYPHGKTECGAIYDNKRMLAVSDHYSVI
jgi:hypothetical protein